VPPLITSPTVSLAKPVSSWPVSADGVDLAVVAEHPEHLGQIPVGEGVGGVAAMEDDRLGSELRLAQVGVEAPELLAGGQRLVDEGAGGEGRDVEVAHLPLQGRPDPEQRQRQILHRHHSLPDQHLPDVAA
jgi:hypothetical protein